MIESGATFSPCRTYRYSLWRKWDWPGFKGQVVFIGLNPSIADEVKPDPTIKRCMRFVQDWSYGELLMLNAYAFVATEPKDMKAASDPIGKGNDTALWLCTMHADLIVAAWGVLCDRARAKAVCERINRPIHCLGKTKDGFPKHPLYLRADTKPELFWEPKLISV